MNGTEKKIKLFIVDDDQLDLQLIKRTFANSEQYELTLFSNGEDFLNHLQLNPDIVTIDYNMPRHNGVELLKKIKEFNSSTLVIVLSGQDNVEVVVDAYNNGASNYIVKNDNAMVELHNSVKNHRTSITLRNEIQSLKEEIVDYLILKNFFQL